jgi:hypothetical protein
MPAAYSNLYIEQNADFLVTITIDDVYRNAYDLNFFTANSQIRKSYYSANATAIFTTLINPSNSTLTLGLDANTTANIVSGRYVYDAIITNSNTHERIRIIEGIIDVSPCVSR